MKNFKTVDEYFSGLPKSTRDSMQKLRDVIKQVAPKAEEVISYNMPAFKRNGMLVWYAAYKKHIGFYQGLRELRLSKTNWPITRLRRAQFSSRWKKGFP